MKHQDFINEFTDYFTSSAHSGNYSGIQIQSISDIIRPIKEDNLSDLMEQLKKDNDIKKIGVKQIILACIVLGISYHKLQPIKPINWLCECCGKGFKYIPMSSDEDKIDSDLFDICPQCGYQPEWTEQRKAYLYYGLEFGKSYFEKIIKEKSEKYKLGNPPYFQKAKLMQDINHEEQRIKKLVSGLKST